MEIICSKCDGEGTVEAKTHKEILYALAYMSQGTIKVTEAVSYLLKHRLSNQSRRSLYTYIFHMLDNEGWNNEAPGIFKLPSNANY